MQTVKSILKKVEESGEHAYLALLDYHNTPTDGVSPAQALMNRPLKSTIPTTPEHLKPVLINHDDFAARRKVQQ